jgi:hypothetical protein
MADAGNAFIGSLTAEQKTAASIPFEDEERKRWFFVPLQDKQRQSTRKGLAFEKMTESQKKLALALLRSGLSETGYEQAVTIMSLESILRDLEKGGAMVRDPNWYFVTIFGTPSKTGKWGWRIEGHHLSLNYTIVEGQVLSATPCFFGANPAEVMAGDRKGTKPIADVEARAKALVEALDDDQKKVVIQPKQFPEIDQIPAAKIGAPVGLPAEKMTDNQRKLLVNLLKTYTQRLPSDIGNAQWSAAERAGVGKIHFAYAGGLKQGEPHTYRIQGPTFLVQFLNIQADSAKNPANHIHSVWRDLPADFGLAAP